MIRYFDTTSPLQFLKDISGGAEPTKVEMKIIEDVMFGQKLNPGVVNVLIDNVLRIADKKLPRSLVEVIAGEWTRNEIKTVKEAMELAKKNRRQYMERAKEKKTTKPGNYIKRNRFARKYCPTGLIKMKIRQYQRRVSLQKQLKILNKINVK